jgi:hypothetical protein
VEMGISKTCSLVSEFEERACRNRLRTVNFPWHPFFVSGAIKKVFCRENGGIEVVELTMIKASNTNNNESIREIIVILVCMGCISC